MARKTTALAKDETTETEKKGALALVQSDELAGVLDGVELETDGLEEADSSDRRISALVFNFKGTDDAGDPVPANAFFDTVTEEVKKKVRLALLTLHKSNSWAEYDQAEGRTRVRCRSWDREHGEMDDGTVRACKGCPDKEWRRDPETGKRTRRCADVHTLVALDLDDGQPKVLRCKKTSERPWKDYLNKHFLGKRVVNGRRQNLPLFAVETEVSLEMVKGGAAPYAVPVFERGDVFQKDEILFFAQAAKSFRDDFADDVRSVADGAEGKDTEEASAAADTSFSPEDFSDDDGAGASSANRF